MRAASAPPRLTGLSLAFATLLLGTANFVVLLDTTIVNVSVPHIAGGLAVSPAQGTWAITSYLVAEAIVVPLAGWLAQRFGTLRMFIFSMAGFAIASVACGMATTFEALIFFRIVQGLCGGPIMPMSQTLLIGVSPPEKLQQTMAFWTMTTVAGPILGPFLGGLIADSAGWSWIFFINVPLAAAVILAGRVVLRGHETATRRVSVDYVGLVILIVWVAALQVLLESGRELGWFSSPRIVVLALVAAIGLASFVIWELTAENPMVDLRIFRHGGFVAGCLTSCLTNGAFFGSMVLIMLWLQTSMNYTATMAGYAAALNGVLVVLMCPVVGYLGGKVDPRALVSFGVIGMAAVAFWRSNFTTDYGFGDIAVTFFALGFFLPFYLVPAMTILLASVKPNEIASAAGLSTFLRTTSAAFATSMMITGWQNVGQAQRSEIVGGLNQPQEALGSLGSAGLEGDKALAVMEQVIEQQSLVLAIDRVFLFTVLIFAAAAASIWFTRRPTPSPGD